jgi:4-hydroxythreonine-4-phosphate dehydrogenase
VQMCERLMIGITMGDPASIGPEITVKALAEKDVYDNCRPLVIGDAGVMEAACRIVGREDIKIHPVSSVSEALFKAGTIDVYDMKLVDPETLERGRVSAAAGDAAFQYVKKVIQLAMAGEIDATVTNAFNKEAINLAGHHYSGHTEVYAEFTGTRKYTMMLAHENLRVVHVSTHVSLREACDRVKKDRVLEVIQIADQACRDLGIEKPRVGVAGLNPHSGENGLFGREEIDEIRPAIEAARAQGIDADGPAPPDTIFSKARGGWYDIVVAMYHDQGHIPLKVVGFVYNEREKKWDAVAGVNITLGLPIVRASVDHGTAFDQAGQGVANERSLRNAIDYGIRLAKSRKEKMRQQADPQS